MAIFTAIAAAITSAFFTIAGAMGATLATATLATVGTIVGYVGAALIYGGVALSVSMLSRKKGASYGDTSATYGNAVLQTQTNQDLPIPMLYGTVKLAGNRIWQDDDGSKTIKRIVGFAEGEITDFTDIRLNDIESSKISGIKINKYLGTSTQAVDSIVGGNNQAERVEKVGSLKTVAYLAVSVPRSNDIDVNYNLTTIVKGRKVRIYITPNIYKIEYSENPAWIMLDFLISYNGLGLALNNDGTINDSIVLKLFDINSFIESAAFCDKKIPYTNSKGETKYSPRFTFNMIFDSQTSARDLIDEIYRSCRGGLFIKNGKLQFKIDKAEPVSKVFTANDIVKGSENFQTIPNEEHYDILKLVYISPDHEWQKVEAFAEIPEYRDGVPIEHSVNCYSITNFQQASRLAWYYVNSKILCPYFGTFKTDYRAYDLEVGDVIQIDSLLMGLKNYLVKVTSVVDDGAGTFTINWRTYDERLYSDELGSKEPRVLVSNLNDAYAVPDNVTNFNVVQNKNLLNFNWTALSNKEVTYEIREGETWEQGNVIAKNISTNSFVTPATSTGILKYWIKATGKYNESKLATEDVISIDSIPELNEIVSIYPITYGGFFGEDTWVVSSNNWQENDYYTDEDGTWLDEEDEYLEIIDDILQLKPNGNWEETGQNWQEDGYAYYIDGLKYWNASVYSKGCYTSNIYDLGEVLTTFLSFNAEKITKDKSAEYLIEFRISNDKENWGEWSLAIGGQYEFRYIQARIKLISPNNNLFGIKNFCISIDVPDREEKYTNRIITNALDGLTIYYATDNESKIKRAFNIAEPHVIPGSKQNNAYAVVDSSKAEKCVIKLYTNTGTLTTGSINVTVSGY